jgi:hypothetical protein
MRTTTTTAKDTMVSGNSIDHFHAGDRIEVIYRRSKHYGRTGVITKVSDPCLSVGSDDPRPGSYVDYQYARLITKPQPTTNSKPAMRREPTIRIDDHEAEEWMTTVSEDAEEEDNALVSLMESLAIQTAVGALALSNNMADIEKAIDEQADRIHAQARRLLQQRHANART